MPIQPIENEQVGWTLDRLREEQEKDPDVSSFVKTS